MTLFLQIFAVGLFLAAAVLLPFAYLISKLSAVHTRIWWRAAASWVSSAREEMEGSFNALRLALSASFAGAALASLLALPGFVGIVIGLVAAGGGVAWSAKTHRQPEAG